MNRPIALLALALLLLALAASPAAAQKNRDFRACDSKSNTETRMAVCTRAINSGLFRGKQLAINYNNRGWAYNDKGDYDRAIADLSEAIRLDPQLAFAYQNRGMSYIGKRDYNRAIADFSDVIRLNPKGAGGYSGRARSYVMKEDYDRALADLTEAIRLDPKNAAGLLSYRGWVFHEKRDYDRAIEDLDQAVRLNPKDPTPIHNRGKSFLEKGDYDRAIADSNEAIRLDPKSANTYHNRAKAFHEKRDYDRAITDFNQAVRLDPKLTRSLVGRGKSKAAKGDLSAAYQDVVEALALEPSNSDAQKLRDQLRTAIASPAPTPTKTETAISPIAEIPAIVLQPSPTDGAISGPRVALVIGNGRYQHATILANPANDAADVSSSLRKLGFEVVEGRDLNKRAMEDKVREFGRKLDGAKLALFFYAGHGLQVGGRNYLIPVDGKLERQGDLSFETIDVSQVLAQMESELRVNLVFLDACRDNPLTRSLARALGTRSSAVGQGLASIQSAVGTMIAYATQPDAVALDGTGRNSPFTTALLKHINTRGLEIGSLMRRVRAEVVQATSGKQVPWDHSSLLGDVVLAQ